MGVSPEEEGSQQRGYYARLVERAARRKEGHLGGGSVTLLLLQPSVSVLPAESSIKETYTLADFEAEGFTNTVCPHNTLAALAAASQHIGRPCRGLTTHWPPLPRLHN